MSLHVEVHLKEFLKDYNVDEILEEIVDSFPKEQRKALLEDIAAWCAENIDEDIMLEAYKE